MRRQQVLVRVLKADGKWGSVDALDLDDESFRAFILDRLLKAKVVAGLLDEHSGESVILRERKDE
jgi:hypothetical protein